MDAKVEELINSEAKKAITSIRMIVDGYNTESLEASANFRNCRVVWPFLNIKLEQHGPSKYNGRVYVIKPMFIFTPRLHYKWFTTLEYHITLSSEQAAEPELVVSTEGPIRVNGAKRPNGTDVEIAEKVDTKMHELGYTRHSGRGKILYKKSIKLSITDTLVLQQL